MTNVNIYYGGRGLIEDPVNFVISKLSQVLEELNLQVKKYNFAGFMVTRIPLNGFI